MQHLSPLSTYSTSRKCVLCLEIHTYILHPFLSYLHSYSLVNVQLPPDKSWVSMGTMHMAMRCCSTVSLEERSTRKYAFTHPSILSVSISLLTQWQTDLLRAHVLPAPEAHGWWQSAQSSTRTPAGAHPPARRGSIKRWYVCICVLIVNLSLTFFNLPACIDCVVMSIY